VKISQSKLSRRKFLFALGAGSAAATAALVVNKTQDAPPEKQEKIADSKGYRLTEHVQNYYRTAKV